jgi:hypothetical protein
MPRSTIIVECVADGQSKQVTDGAYMPVDQTHATVHLSPLFGRPPLDDPCPAPTLDSSAVCGPYYAGTWVWAANDLVSEGWRHFTRSFR